MLKDNGYGIHSVAPVGCLAFYLRRALSHRRTTWHLFYKAEVC